VQEFSGEKIESTIFGGNSCSYLDGRGATNIFVRQWLAEEIILVLRFFLRHGGIRAQPRIFLMFCASRQQIYVTSSLQRQEIPSHCLQDDLYVRFFVWIYIEE